MISGWLETPKKVKPLRSASDWGRYSQAPAATNRPSASWCPCGRRPPTVGTSSWPSHFVVIELWQMKSWRTEKHRGHNVSGAIVSTETAWVYQQKQVIQPTNWCFQLPNLILNRPKFARLLGFPDMVPAVNFTVWTPVVWADSRCSRVVWSKHQAFRMIQTHKTDFLNNTTEYGYYIYDYI